MRSEIIESSDVSRSLANFGEQSKCDTGTSLELTAILYLYARGYRMARTTNPNFMAGVPELMILRLLQNRPMYGYEIVEAIRTETGDVNWPLFVLDI